jgi:hypothetical protein
MKTQMDEKQWRLEVKSPLAPTLWQRLWGFNEDQLTAFPAEQSLFLGKN